jgi:type II secretory pathway component PulF
LGLLLQNEVRINEALSIVADSTENTLYSGALRAARTRVTVGKTLASCYQEYPQLWPMLVVQMIQTGEATGTLASTCGYLSEMYESDIRDWTKTMTVLLEPLLMIGMGLSVGFIAISIITPIYGITAQLHS